MVKADNKVIIRVLKNYIVSLLPSIDFPKEVWFSDVQVKRVNKQATNISPKNFHEVVMAVINSYRDQTRSAILMLANRVMKEIAIQSVVTTDGLNCTPQISKLYNTNPLSVNVFHQLYLAVRTKDGANLRRGGLLAVGFSWELQPPLGTLDGEVARLLGIDADDSDNNPSSADEIEDGSCEDEDDGSNGNEKGRYREEEEDNVSENEDGSSVNQSGNEDDSSSSGQNEDENGSEDGTDNDGSKDSANMMVDSSSGSKHLSNSDQIAPNPKRQRAVKRAVKSAVNSKKATGKAKAPAKHRQTQSRQKSQQDPKPRSKLKSSKANAKLSRSQLQSKSPSLIVNNAQVTL